MGIEGKLVQTKDYTVQTFFNQLLIDQCFFLLEQVISYFCICMNSVFFLNKINNEIKLTVFTHYFISFIIGPSIYILKYTFIPHLKPTGITKSIKLSLI